MSAVANAVRTRLAEILPNSGLDRPLGDVAAYLSGVAAAPPTPQGFTGVSLLGDLAPAVRDSLQALAAEQAADYAAAVENRGAAAARLAALRAELRKQNIDGCIVPLNDEYHGEYVPRRGQRLAWLTGFTGSAGVALVLADRAAVFTDGRYTLQVAAQVDHALYVPHHITEEPPTEWLAHCLAPGQRFGYDPWLHTVDAVAKLAAACARAGASLVALDANPIDAIWPDQPPPPLSPVKAQPLIYAGETSSDKRRRLAADLRAKAIDCVVLSLPESLAWLLNVRGGDVPRTPLPLSFGLLHADASVAWFIDRRKLSPAVIASLGDGVNINDPEQFGAALDRLGRRQAQVQADPATAPSWVFDRLQAAGARLRRGDDPCQLPKACKNPVELQGTRDAHRRDGVAMVRFLAWLDQALAGGIAVDEIAAAARLEAFRREGALFQDLSFDTISGAGPNGAIVHYRVTPESNRRLEPGTLYLLDSGAQYLDGTTDITRTIAIGMPSAEMRDRFTQVLKGHIALATCRFPQGTSGGQLDVLARHALWQAGLDYDHGTGHGVGSYLSVHEGPQRISKLGSAVPLQPGMIVSNEPGYYKAGAYGIRIETLLAVVPAARPGDEKPFLGFETLTKAPVDRRLINPALLSLPEIGWLDAYHAEVRDELTPLLDDDSAAWLAQATRYTGEA